MHRLDARDREGQIAAPQAEVYLRSRKAFHPIISLNFSPFRARHSKLNDPVPHHCILHDGLEPQVVVCTLVRPLLIPKHF